MQLDIFPKNLRYTAAEQAVIAYLEKHINQIEGLTITRLAQESLTSNATIIRLSHKVGCSGFKDLKVKIIKNIELNRLTDNHVDFSFPFSPVDDLPTIKNAMADLYQNGLNLLRDKIDMTKVKEVAALILHAARVFIYASGDTGITVKSFINLVNKLNIYPILATENGEQGNITARLLPRDLAIFVSYNKYAFNYREELATLLDKGNQIVLITANTKPPVFKKATVGIAIPDEEKQKKVATFYSQFAFHFVLNLVFAILYKEKVLS